jgi:alpha-L-fucosidase
MIPANATAEEIISLAANVTASPRQQRWLDLGFTAFVHFGMNTFTDREWGDGKESPATFLPTEFDAEQWTGAFRQAGMRGVVLTCKHHDGFCLWPTATTEHSVRNSPWRDGAGDVVKEVMLACRSAGLEFGIYLSPWDRHEPKFGTADYSKFFLAQLEELLTQYGPIHDIWFDGAHAPKDDPKIFDWLAVWQTCRKHQPGACISVMGADVRWCGNEAGHTRAAEWNVIPLATDDDRPAEESWNVAKAYFDVDVTARDLGSREQLLSKRRLVWWPAMTNTSIRPGWFWHPHEDGAVRSLSELTELYLRAVGGGTQLLLNVPPNSQGRIADGDVRRLHELGEVLRATFGTDFAQGARIKHFPDVREVWLDRPATVDLVALSEDVRNVGQRVEAFRIDAFDGNQWLPIARGTTIGPRRYVKIPTTTAGAFRVWIEKQRAAATLASFALHRQAAVLPAPRITRDPAGMIQIATAADAEVRYTIDGNPVTADSPLFVEAFPFALGGVVRARAFPRASAGASVPVFAVEASARFGLSTARWRVHACSSEQAPNEAADLAIDGDPDTHWHSQWDPTTPSHPHSLAIDLGAEHTLTGFTYLPRTEGSNGTIVDYRFRVSLDGLTWTTTIQSGSFANIAANPTQQLVRFESPVRARYVELTATSAVGGKPWASVAELGVLVD